jgi:DNA-binding GntR family transcriptional regulator
VNGSRASEVIPVLEQEIVTGILIPGSRLDETLLAQRFGVSRTPVREALMHLSASGLVEIRPRRGAIVATITLKDLMDMFEVMADLEAMCGRLAARRITETEKVALIQSQKVCASLTDSDPDDYYQANLKLHSLIYQASHNTFLEKQTKELRQRLMPHRRLQVRMPGRIKTSSKEHGELIEAILEGDSELAEQRLRAHVTIQGERFADFLSSLPSHIVEASA